jgi:hypothetical protein
MNNTKTTNYTSVSNNVNGNLNNNNKPTTQPQQQFTILNRTNTQLNKSKYFVSGRIIYIF